jgi:hypothetical protein
MAVVSFVEPFPVAPPCLWFDGNLGRDPHFGDYGRSISTIFSPMPLPLRYWLSPLWFQW